MENLEAVYPVVNIFYIEDLEKEKISLSKKPVKEFSKYLYIEPAFTQKDLNYIGNIDLEEAFRDKEEVNKTRTWEITRPST